MAERKAFNFYKSYYDVAKELHPKEREQFLFAILQKQFDNVDPNFINMLPMAKFAYIGQQHSVNAQVVGFENAGKVKTRVVPTRKGASEGTIEGASGQVQEQGKLIINKDVFTFDEFWAEYPNKVAKVKCKPKYESLPVKDKIKIKETLKAFIQHKQFPGYNHPNPETYLNQKRWDDVIVEKQIEQPAKEKPIIW